MSDTPNPYAPPVAALDEPASHAAPLFAVSPAKLLILSWATLSLYTTWWSYKNWRALDGRGGERLMPIPRAIFAGFTNFSLFPRIQRWAASEGVQSRVPHELLALAFLVSSFVIQVVPDESAWLLVLIAGMGAAYLPSNALAARVNRAVAPSAPPTVGWTPINIAGAVIAGLFWTLALIGALVPMEDAG